MEFEKATIQRYNPKSLSPEGDPIEVLFNPTEYRLTKSNRFAEVPVPGLEAPRLQFGRGNADTLTMQLFFDTYEQGTDVRDYTKQITKLLEVDPKLHKPPICLFNWGELNLVCVLERADQRFVLFRSDGVPVRATVDVAFKRFFEAEKQIGKQQSADFARHYVVRRGDTLSGIAGQVYGDPAIWRSIAVENDIDNPLAVQPGQVLVIPVRV